MTEFENLCKLDSILLQFNYAKTVHLIEKNFYSTTSVTNGKHIHIFSCCTNKYSLNFLFQFGRHIKMSG